MARPFITKLMGVATIDGRIRFADLYAGVGGFRLGLERASEKFECVWSCENDRYCRQVYRKHWGEPEAGDVREVDGGEVPEHDLLAAGFPCQSFSLAGKRKGFEDTRGTLFHEICRIARAKRPPLLLLENVKGLLSTQDRGAFRVVLESLDELGYDVEWQVLNSKNFGVPQNRPRVFIIGHLDGFGKGERQIFPVRGEDGRDTGEDGGEGDKMNHPAITGAIGRAGSSSEYLRSLNSINRIIQKSPDWREDEELREFVENSPTIRREMGNNLPMVLDDMYDGELRKYFDYSPSVTAHETGGWEDIKVMEHKKITERTGEWGDGFKKDVSFCVDGSSGSDLRIHKENRIRKLTPVECERLQGFPDGWTESGIDEDGNEVEISNTQRYKMMGNAVTVNVVEFLGNRLLEAFVDV